MRDRNEALLVGDALALDLLNTVVAFPDGVIDFLEDGRGLLAWMTLVKLIDAPDAERLAQGESAKELDAVAGDVRGLREWFRVFVEERKGRIVLDDAFAASSHLNTLLTADDTFSVLVAGEDDVGPPLRLRVVRRFRSPRSLLLSVADMLAKFLCEEALAAVKACEGRGCKLLFLDYSLGSTRRWCSMAMCGHRTAGLEVSA